jgi:hypothetical protein
VSKGRGLVAGNSTGSLPTLYSPENMHVLLFNWLSNTFRGNHNFVNGAQGGVGAEYFGWCFSESLLDLANGRGTHFR